MIIYVRRNRSTIDIINKKIIFNSACNQDDIVAIYQLYHTDKANIILRVNSKYFYFN